MFRYVVPTKRVSGSSWAAPIGIESGVYNFGKDGKIDVLSFDETSPASLALQPLALEFAKPSADEETSVFGIIVYVAAWIRDRLILRRGDQLCGLSNFAAVSQPITQGCEKE